MSCTWGLCEEPELVRDVEEIKDKLLYARDDIEDIKLCMIKVMQILLGDKYNDEMKKLFGERAAELNNFDEEIKMRYEIEKLEKEDEKRLKEKLAKESKERLKEWEKEYEETQKKNEKLMEMSEKCIEDIKKTIKDLKDIEE